MVPAVIVTGTKSGLDMRVRVGRSGMRRGPRTRISRVQRGNERREVAVRLPNICDVRMLNADGVVVHNLGVERDLFRWHDFRYVTIGLSCVQTMPRQFDDKISARKVHVVAVPTVNRLMGCAVAVRGVKDDLILLHLQNAAMRTLTKMRVGESQRGFINVEVLELPKQPDVFGTSEPIRHGSDLASSFVYTDQIEYGK